MANIDLFQDIFRPVLLLAIGALAYFVRQQFTELKKSIERLYDKIENLPDKYVEQVDCSRHIGECVLLRRERQDECIKAIGALRETQCELVTCVNKHVDECNVKQRG